MATLTVRSLDDMVYEGLKACAATSHQSMEATARDILHEGVKRRQRWQGGTLADLSGDQELSLIDTPYVRSTDFPRDIDA